MNIVWKSAILLLAMLCVGKAAAAETTKQTGMADVRNCFRGPFESYDKWVGFLSNKPGFKLENFPFTQEKFETYQSTLSCNIFNYQVGDVTVQGYLLYPKDTKSPLPAVIYNRGGNTSYGRVNMGRMMHDLMPLAAEGFVVIGSQYRWSRQKLKSADFVADGSEDQFGGIDVEDVLALVPIIKNLEIVDSSRLGVYGSSRGGMQSYLFAKQYPDIKAMAIVAGLSDVFSFRDRSEKSRFLLSKLIPDFAENEEGALKARSAIYWADELPKVPVLLIHAKDDERVTYANALQMSEQFTKYGIPYEFKSYDTGGHDLTGHKEEVDRALIEWFKKHL